MLATLAMLLALTSAEAPKIPSDIESEYYRSDAAVAHIKPAWDAANADLQAAAQAVVNACGEKYQPRVEGKHMICVPKQPEPPKEAPKK